MSTTIDRKETVLQDRKRPKTTSSKAKTSRVPFGNNPYKVLPILKVYNKYNFNMLQVNQFDHIASQNNSLRPVRRGGYQSIEHWLLRSVLINTYLLALYSDVAEPRQVKFRSQEKFRINIIEALLQKAKLSHISKKRTISYISTEADDTPAFQHTQVSVKVQKDCVCCKGIRLGDRPQKRVALAQIAANEKRSSKRTSTVYRCLQCDVAICKKNGCWKRYYGI
jgi:hypothetical protein